MTTQPEATNTDDRWQQHYNNAAELLFGKFPGDTMTAEEDEDCCTAADEAMAAEGLR